MKVFRYPKGHTAGQTMTVGDLLAKLAEYPSDMPVMAEWEGVNAHIQPEMFSVDLAGKGHPDDECDCLIIDVNEY